MGSKTKMMDDEEKKDEFKPLHGAQVLWPPDMPDEMLDDTIVCTMKVLADNNNDIEGKGDLIAEHVKRHMDEKWEPHWHVFLGTSFGCHAVHERNRFAYFTVQSKERDKGCLLYTSPSPRD
eukprot:TRINITY_DN14179_c0_g2_i1.p2 TRINITY_DN14179_c0_g2~~TRINITY_DN14179_c0_g2_i1.p2  ORF type:complete len:121 (+),score=45.71 TRINITY_DN14179_c0_g2_i1:82-444(+)